MNENIDLTKILKNCPIGWKLYSPLCGEVEFSAIEESGNYPIIAHHSKKGSLAVTFSKKGNYFLDAEGAECLLLPSKEQRDWSKFTAPWYKKEKFDPKTLKPFDKVLVRDGRNATWFCKSFSHIGLSKFYKYATNSGLYMYCIPYNDDTKHLVGTIEEAPEYYRYWED